MTNLFIVRGLPGSGKSTLGKAIAGKLCQSGNNSIHIETDQYFVDAEGVYNFDRDKLKEAHHWCRARTRECLEEGTDVIVCNTFTTLWEMSFYKELAAELNVQIFYLECKGEHGNIHNVPERVIERMRARWEIIPKQWYN